MKVFSSGSCRLLKSLYNGKDKIDLIHGGGNWILDVIYLSVLYNVYQHIQFIKWILDDIELPHSVLKRFLNYNLKNALKCPSHSKLPLSKKIINEQFYDCDWHIFEISSLKRPTLNGFEIKVDSFDQIPSVLNISEEELYNSIQTLINLLPKNKKILFQTHFRLNIIYNDDNKKITAREIIYNTLMKFIDIPNVFVHDPSVIFENNQREIFGNDEQHFSELGYSKNFQYIYDNYLTKY